MIWPCWNDSAEAWIAALLATVVYYGQADAGSRSFQTLRDFLANPAKLDAVVKLMTESDAWDGMLARMGGALGHFVDREKSSTLTSVSRHLRFLGSLAVAESIKTSTFDPTDLRNGKMTIYLILPPEHMRSQSPLLRLWIGSFLQAVIRGGLQEKNKVHFVLDEAASLGHLESLDHAVDKYRGYGIRCQFYYQSLGQLKTCFPDGQDQTLLSNTSQVFFGVNDPATASYVSDRLGEQTLIVESGGSSVSTPYQSSSGPNQNSSKSWSSSRNSNWAPQARRLLKPEEVAALPPRVAVTFTPGVPPICTTLLRYYEEKGFGRHPKGFRRAWAAAMMLVRSAVLLALLGGAACVLSHALVARSQLRPLLSPVRPAGIVQR